MKQNLLRTYEGWSPEYIARGGNTVRSQALFALAWFHAVVQERRVYIPQVGHSPTLLAFLSGTPLMCGSGTFGTLSLTNNHTFVGSALFVVFLFSESW